jgi:hypothetical protein
MLAAESAMSENVIRIPKPRTGAQRAAARANKSKGSTIEDCKARSALNAVRLGLLAAPSSSAASPDPSSWPS